MGGKTRAQLGLSDAWCQWVSDNLLTGVKAAELVATLTEREVPAAVAQREVTRLAGNPAALAAARSYRARLRQLELLAELARRLAGQAANPQQVERRTELGADEFFDRYWATNQPVVWTDLSRGWAAREWTPEGLVERFGDVEVEACVGRDQDPEPDMNWQRHAQRMPFREFVARVRAAGHSNDVYLIASNRALDDTGLAALRSDLEPDPALFDSATIDGGTSLWIGPGGSVTPLHHDTTNIAFNQLYGRKRIRLVAPCELRILSEARGFYAGRGLDEMTDQDLLIKEVVLHPGESLFIPAGWWHDVQALDVSISFSLLHFRRPNRLNWYCPGVAE